MRQRRERQEREERQRRERIQQEGEWRQQLPDLQDRVQRLLRSCAPRLRHPGGKAYLRGSDFTMVLGAPPKAAP